MNREQIRIVGVGGAGGRVIDRLSETFQEEAPPFIAVDTDAAALDATRAATRFTLGEGRLGGQGTGGDVAAAGAAAEADAELLSGLVAGAQIVLAVCGLGGGTGTVIAPALMEAAQRDGALALCLATLPFSFEGAEAADRAETALPVLRTTCNGLIPVPSDRLAAATGEPRVEEAFRQADELLGHAAASLWRLLTRPGYISLDMGDLRMFFRGSGGQGALGYGEGRGRNRAATALRALLDGPLLEDGQGLASARALLVSLNGGPDLTLAEVGDIMKAVSARVGDVDHVAMGTVVDSLWRGCVSVTVLAADHWQPEEPQPAASPAREPAEGRPKRRRRKRAMANQTEFGLGISGKGRFKNVEPTIMDGQDLDIPTFIRRGVQIEK